MPAGVGFDVLQRDPGMKENQIYVQQLKHVLTYSEKM